MTNKNTIVLGIIAVLILAGVVWYASQNEQPADQAASVAGIVEEEENKPEQASIEDFILGDPNAPVLIEEYSSHFCGHCVNFHKETLPLLMDKYIKTGKVKLISRYVSPMELSTAVLCAQEQDNFSEFSDYLFEHASELESVDDVKAISGTLNLNQDDFNQCFDSKKYNDKIEEWFNKATEAGVEGTPTFFVNGQKITGNQPFAIFEQIIEQELAK